MHTRLMGTKRVDEAINMTWKRRILVYGSRGIELSDLELEAVLLQWPFPLNKICLISGGAKGPDRAAIFYAEKHGCDVIEIPAKWDEFGSAAGMKRNKEMGDIAQYACGWWDGESRGTAGMTSILTKKNTPLILTMKTAAVAKVVTHEPPKGL